MFNFGQAKEKRCEKVSYGRLAKRFCLPVLALSAALIIGTSLLSASEADTANKGSGTAADPYVITTVEQLAAFRDGVNNGTISADRQNVKLAVDLDLKGSAANPWTPIGTSYSSGDMTVADIAFTGTFDGQGHIIKGLYAEHPDLFSGLFSYANGDFVIKNLTVSGEVSGYKAGLIVGYFEKGTVQNCAVSGKATGLRKNQQGSGNVCAGGIVGQFEDSGKIINCQAKNFTADAAASQRMPSRAGGIAGQVFSGCLISKCRVESADIKASGNSTGKYPQGSIVGGICGTFYNSSKASNCTVSDFSLSADVAGGIGGTVNLNSAITNGAVFKGKITGGAKDVGGIAGYVSGCTISDSAAQAMTFPQTGNRGGIAGHAIGIKGVSEYENDITDCVWMVGDSVPAVWCGLIEEMAIDATTVTGVVSYDAGRSDVVTDCLPSAPLLDLDSKGSGEVSFTAFPSGSSKDITISDASVTPAGLADVAIDGAKLKITAKQNGSGLLHLSLTYNKTNLDDFTTSSVTVSQDIALTVADHSIVVTPAENRASGSSGGCNAGFVSLALLALALPMAMRLRKRR